MSKEGSGSCGCPNPSCRPPQTQRPTCRPPPTLFSRLNCTACNRLFFFIVGAGVAIYYDKLKEAARKAEEEANKDPKQKEKERKEKEKQEKAEKDRKEKERKEQEKKDKERKAKEQKEREKKEKEEKAAKK
ncbi:merozoite surface protein 9 [Drosophila sulfurigaster albostrigata]|uniref:merozoite surface protein 9 n=1 Tax=Drosophila sulfurigaster albostrigata TaxID=89887 RepID=UPI002D21DA77|nr:merozoite surface protein 9 [Drosophila sulfurigaster albostrigata]